MVCSIWGLPGAPAEADEGGGARAMAKGTRPTRGDLDVPEDPRGLERAFASTAVNSEAAGPHTVGTRHRTDWPTQGNATEPRPHRAPRSGASGTQKLWRGRAIGVCVCGSYDNLSVSS
jgi:hypothetical protein